MWGAMAQQFLDRDMAVKIMGPGNDEQWFQVGPKDVQSVAGGFAYKIEGSEESLSRQQERGEAVALLNAFAPLLGSPQGQMVNIQPILERVAVAYDFPNPQALFNAPQPQQQAVPTPDFNPAIRSPMLGAVPASHLNINPGMLQQSPQLGQRP